MFGGKDNINQNFNFHQQLPQTLIRPAPNS